jgi:hypothetical protein
MIGRLVKEFDYAIVAAVFALILAASLASLIDGRSW